LYKVVNNKRLLNGA